VRDLTAEPVTEPVTESRADVAAAAAAPDLPARVLVTEVVARDGFQDEPRQIGTGAKVRVLHGLASAGVRALEATSFVSPHAVPQMADAEQVLAGLGTLPGVEVSALVPNVRGAERALATDVDALHLVVSASDGHSLSNVRRTTDEALDGLEQVVRLVRAQRDARALSAGIATAFVCPFEGPVPLDRLSRVVGRLVDAGVGTVTLADTIGRAHPRQVSTTLAALRTRHPEVSFGLHLHDTAGMALANTLAALSVGVDRFDASLGGLGGCPFAPGAAGNVATEDLAHMLESMGVDTGLDVPALVEAARALPDLVGHPLTSRLARAGVDYRVPPRT